MENEKLTSREFWINDSQDFIFSRHENHGIDSFIKQYIPSTADGSCLEIGSFPGPFLTTFGDLGYILNGVDFHPANQYRLPVWLRSLNYRTGQFITQDFFEFATTEQFDVVCSFGFIEHFTNYNEVIRRHAQLVKDNGYLIITTPNFAGPIQKWLHKTFDKKNLSYHNLASMQPQKWASMLEEEGFEIKFQGFFGDFWFWRSPENMSTIKRKSFWFIERLIPRIRKILWFQSSAFSAYCGIVAVKK